MGKRRMKKSLRNRRDAGDMTNNIIVGAIAGFAATAPMTIVMERLHQRLQPSQQFALPPRQITTRLAKNSGALPKLSEMHRRHLTLINHFSYGAAMGALYSATADRLSIPSTVKGPAFGLVVWAANYIGWLPAAGMFPAATKISSERNGLMIAAHLVWGLATGILTRELGQRPQTRLRRDDAHHRVPKVRLRKR